ncbi:alpha/beta hydrolase [Micromonospora rifamycinica]|uniref:alpha/beta fold hydrolase n=1 Tax=Micromonospora rifamycinica TaxID=291594 RepID=UPI002E2D9198|nr:alpha/beta hydrolase [Micromonospora rifamycinica]
MTTTLRQLRPPTPDGPLVVFAHGLEDSWASWLPLSNVLPSDWYPVALDLPWRPGNDYRWRHRPSSQWLADGLDGLDRRPDLLVAHSYGANALLELLCAGDRRVPDTVILICPLYRPPDVVVTWRLFERARRSFEQHIHDSLRSRLGTRLRALDPDVVDRMIAKAFDRVGPSGFLTVFDQFSASASMRLDRVTARVLVLAGGSDPTLSPQAARTLADGMPHAVLSVGESYDHFCYARQPEDVASRLRAFLDVAPVVSGHPEGAAT